ncbi:hypothetical protein ABTY53_11990 [Streptomyces noursei]|uniref:hypothetical protein n=1 Tax=Streptomyces noursei TaxID=1971 RepID=UPI00331B7EBE
MFSATATPLPARPSAVPWTHARVLAHGAARPSPARTAPLRAAAGLTLAGDLRALQSLPAFDTAAMDGYAVAGRGPWRVRAAPPPGRHVRTTGEDAPTARRGGWPRPFTSGTTPTSWW